MIKSLGIGFNFATSFLVLALCLFIISFLFLQKSVCAHPESDCGKKRTHPAQAVVLSPAKSSNKNPISAFQERQLLKETGRWDRDTLSACKNICLKLGEMEN